MSISTDRRTALQTFGLGLAGAVGLALETSAAAAADKPVKAPPEKPAPPPAEAKPEPPPPEPPPPQIDSASLPSLVPPGAKALPALIQRVAAAPRRRDFATVPMILAEREQWDHEAFDAVIAYRPAPRQAWDNTDIAGGWLTVMRNALNTQIWGFNHPEFLVVSTTRGSALLALYDQAMWDKYQLTRFAGSALGNESVAAIGLLSVAVPVIGASEFTVAPLAGETIDTVGGVVSIVTVAVAGVEVVPPRLKAVATS